jgi:hypothetical protein
VTTGWSGSPRRTATRPRAINDAGLVVGDILGLDRFGMLAWNVQRPDQFRLVAPGSGYFSPGAVTEEGLIVDFRAAVGTEATGFQPLPPATEGAHPLSSDGAGRYVVGWEEMPDPVDWHAPPQQFPVLWTERRPQRLPGLTGGGTAVNGSGVVVGPRNQAGQAVVWSAGRVSVLPQGQSAVPTAVTERNVVAGILNRRPVTWRCR